MSQVIINDIPPYTQAVVPNGGQTVFGTNWTANFASDVVVFLTPVGDAADDLTQVLAYPSQYSVAFIGDELQVQVTLVSPAVQGDVVTITRMTPADRENLYTNNNFLPTMLNNDFGILTFVDQQNQLLAQSRTPRYNYSAIIDNQLLYPTADTILPVLAANQVWAKNANNTAMVAIDVSTFIGGLTEVDTGLGLTGGPITSTGTISFAQMPANTIWGNVTSGTALPTQVSTGYFLQSNNNLSDVVNKATARNNLGLQIGVNVEAWSPALDSLGSLITNANELIYTTAANTYAVLGPVASSVLVTSVASVPSLSQTLPTAVQSNITQLGIQTTALNMGSHQINNVTNPTNPQDVATKNYVDSGGGAFLPLIGGTMSGVINMGNNQINAMADPSSSQDAVTLAYLNGQLANYLAKSGGTMTGSINMGSHNLTNLVNPTNPQDAATKNYVDSVAIGLTVQAACYAATTANLTATYANGASGIGATLTNSGALVAFSVDGTTPPANARILVKNQTTTFQNGIYTLTNQGSGAVAWILTRATDYDQPAEIQPGDLVVINNGTVNAGASFIETDSVSTIGTDPIEFSQFTFSASAVLLKANNLSDVANTLTSFNNISPLTTKGDILTRDGTNNIRLAVGAANGQVLQAASGAASGLAYSTATYPVTTSANQILYSSATNTVAGLGTIAGGVLVTDASSVPSLLANPSAAGKILQSANAAIPAWSTPTYPSASGTTGKIIISDGTNNLYSAYTLPTAAGTSGQLLATNATNFVYTTPTYPIASGTSRTILISNGTNVVYSTETYAAPGTLGNIMTSDGTNWTSAPNSGSTLLTTKGDLFGYSSANARVPVASGDGKVLQVSSGATVGLAYSSASYPVSTTVNQLLYSSSTNTIAGLSVTNNSALTTNNTGVPTWIALSDGQFVIGSSIGAPAAATLSPGNNVTISSGHNTLQVGTTVLGALITQYNVQTFTSTGAFTYTPSVGTTYVRVTLVGAGGASGGTVTTASTTAAAAGGGGGASAVFILTAAQIGVSLAGVVGAGGTVGTAGNHVGNNGGNTTLATISAWTLAGGTGGSGMTGVSTTQIISTSGGTGGTVTTGTGTIISQCKGQTGSPGYVFYITSTGGFAVGGFGGSTPNGPGGTIYVPNGTTSSTGVSGTGYGSGAGGGAAINANSSLTGTAGTNGIAIFEEFIAA